MESGGRRGLPRSETFRRLPDPSFAAAVRLSLGRESAAAGWFLGGPRRKPARHSSTARRAEDGAVPAAAAAYHRGNEGAWAKADPWSLARPAVDRAAPRAARPCALRPARRLGLCNPVPTLPLNRYLLDHLPPAHREGRRVPPSDMRRIEIRRLATPDRPP